MLNGLFELEYLVHTYTRAQALEDGFLVDLNQFIPVRESGYKFPVACTRTVWEIIEKAVKNKKHGNDHKGIIWDILSMSRMHQTKRWGTGALFRVLITGAARRTIFTFKIECGAGDDLAPAFTISLPDED
jgi:hypothetical protein